MGRNAIHHALHILHSHHPSHVAAQKKCKQDPDKHTPETHPKRGPAGTIGEPGGSCDQGL